MKISIIAKLCRDIRIFAPAGYGFCWRAGKKCYLCCREGSASFSEYSPFGEVVSCETPSGMCNGMQENMKRSILTLFVAVAAMLAVACGRSGRYVTSDGAILGTTYHISAHGRGLTPAGIYAGMMDLDARMKASMSIFDSTSLISRVNRGLTDSLDEHLRFNLELARRIGEQYDSRYDVTVEPLTEAWGFASKHATRRPNIDSLLQFVGYDKWHIDGDRVVKSDPRVRFDLNSIAKGYTVDLAAAMLEEMGAGDYIVEIGGEIRCRGVNASGNEWNIGVDSPVEGNMSPGADLYTAIPLQDRALATSGNYRRFYIDGNGRRIVHTIDPRTGRGAVSRLLSATVITDRCATADALATMFMVVGADDAMRMAGSMRDSVQVYFILDDGNDGYEIFTTIDK